MKARYHGINMVVTVRDVSFVVRGEYDMGEPGTRYSPGAISGVTIDSVQVVVDVDDLVPFLGEDVMEELKRAVMRVIAESVEEAQTERALAREEEHFIE